MFVDSSKVLIVESNIPKNQTGPTVGSIGYVIPHWETFSYMVNELKDYIHSGNQISTAQPYFDNNTKNENIGNYNTSEIIYIFKEMHVLFTQFGKNEKHKRCERRPVINIFPIPRKETALKKIEKNDIINSDVIDSVYNYVDEKLNKEDLKDVPAVCVMIPHYTDNQIDLSNDNTEFEAWARSILQNGLLNLYSNTTSQANIFKQKPILAKIRDYVIQYDRPPKVNEIMEWADMDKEVVIDNLRLLHISLINNYDFMAHVTAMRNRFPTKLYESDNLQKLIALGTHCWRIGFNSNRQKIDIHNKNMVKQVSMIAKVQQQLLNKGL